MSASFSVPVYQRRLGDTVELVTLGLGAATKRRSAQGIPRAEERLREDLRKAVEEARPPELARYDFKRGTRLERVRLEVTLRDARKRKISGLCPIIVEPRHAGAGRRLDIGYHPSRPAEWFPLDGDAPVAPTAAAYFADAWKDLDDATIAALWSNGKDALRVLSFSASPRTLLEELPERKRGIWDDLEIDLAAAKARRRDHMKVLPRLGTDLTAAGPPDILCVPRSPYREELATLLGSKRRTSVVIVGPHGSGKSALVEQLVRDLLVHDGHDTHRNLDLVTHVWRVHGKQIIAGMSRLGQWEQRCVEIQDDVRGRRIILLVPDLHLFGRIGRARDCDRALADFFRGPVGRGEITLLGECTAEQLRQLEEDDPAFAASFARVHVAPTSREETFRILLARAREIEASSPPDRPVEIDPLAFQTILVLGDGLFPSHARPGKAVDLLARLCAPRAGDGGGAVSVGPVDVIERLSEETGLPRQILAPEDPVGVDDIVRDLERRVLGQPVAVREAADLVVRIRSGLTDPGRPWGVYLFTGPTGTGKTELAKALAGYVYGSPNRLVRFDMSELSGADAVARLIGDTYDTEGLLTSAVLAQPFSLELHDEIEKAHPQVLNLLLQLFDDGRLTDAAGNTATFTQCIVVMTSNLGARQRPPLGFDEPPDALMQDVARAVREFFAPELFNRIDAVVPFRPLDPQVAIDVTRKELSNLFSRPGLVDRGVFVEVGVAAIERIARDALRAEDGARSLKRFIDDRIGSLLGEEIARAPGAAMQVLRITGGDAGLRVTAEPLVEAEPAARSYALESVFTEPLGVLRERLPDVLRALEGLERSERLAALSEQLRHHLSEHNRGRREHGEPIYNIEWMRITVERLRERVERLATASLDMHHHAIEEAIAQRDVPDPPKARWESSRPTPGRMRFDFGRAGTWWDHFSCIAETHVIARALDRVTSPDQHAVLVELLPVGTGRTLLHEMLAAYASARGEVDGLAWAAAGEVHEHAGSREQLGGLDLGAPEVVVMKLVGLCIRDFLELESGTHVWRSSAREPELLRVRVLPAGPGVTPGAHVRSFRAAREAAERDPAGATVRPDGLLPIVRTMWFDAPARGKAGTLLEMEDYVVGLPHTARVTRIADAFAKLWLYRVSRVDPGREGA